MEKIVIFEFGFEPKPCVQNFCQFSSIWVSIYYYLWNALPKNVTFHGILELPVLLIHFVDTSYFS